MTKNKILTIILVVVLVALVVAVSLIFVKMNKIDNSETVSSLSYKVGALNESGEYQDNTASLVTKNFIEVKNFNTLSFKVVKGDVVKYKIFFFDKEKAMVGVTEDLVTDYEYTVPEGVASFKVMITPLHDAEVSAFEVSKYAGNVKITLSTVKDKADTKTPEQPSTPSQETEPTQQETQTENN